MQIIKEEDTYYYKAEKIASEIAEEANKCCYRTDGYEEALKEFTLSRIKAIIDEVIDDNI